MTQLAEYWADNVSSITLGFKLPGETFKSDTIQIAYIAAGGAILGAFFGAVGSVIGPWWLKKTELDSQRKASEHEARRKAIVEFANKKIDSMREYHQVFTLGHKSDTLIDKLNEANKSATELYSYIKKEDAAVKDWVNQMGHRAILMRPSSINDLVRVDAFLGIGIQYLIAWHVGELATNDLRPYGLDKTNQPVWLESWGFQWPI